MRKYHKSLLATSEKVDFGYIPVRREYVRIGKYLKLIPISIERRGRHAKN